MWEIRVAIPGKGYTAAAGAALPIPTSVCSIFMCPNKGSVAILVLFVCCFVLLLLLFVVVVVLFVCCCCFLVWFGYARAAVGAKGGPQDYRKTVSLLRKLTVAEKSLVAPWN